MSIHLTQVGSTNATQNIRETGQQEETITGKAVFNNIKNIANTIVGTVVGMAKSLAMKGMEATKMHVFTLMTTIQASNTPKKASSTENTKVNVKTTVGAEASEKTPEKTLQDLKALSKAIKGLVDAKQTDGLFRTGGKAADIKTLRSNIGTENFSLNTNSAAQSEDATVMTSALKGELRDLAFLDGDTFDSVIAKNKSLLAHLSQVATARQNMTQRTEEQKLLLENEKQLSAVETEQRQELAQQIMAEFNKSLSQLEPAKRQQVEALLDCAVYCHRQASDDTNNKFQKFSIEMAIAPNLFKTMTGETVKMQNLLIGMVLQNYPSLTNGPQSASSVVSTQPTATLETTAKSEKLGSDTKSLNQSDKTEDAPSTRSPKN